jgi:hypothetical protein
LELHVSCSGKRVEDQQRAFVQRPYLQLQCLTEVRRVWNATVSSYTGVILMLRACETISSSFKEPYEADQRCVTM